MDGGEIFESPLHADSDFVIEDDVGANVILYSSQGPSSKPKLGEVPHTGKVLTLSKVPAGKVPPGKELTPVKVLTSGKELTPVKVLTSGKVMMACKVLKPGFGKVIVLEPGKVVVNTSNTSKPVTQDYVVQQVKEEPPDQMFYETATVVLEEENVANEEDVKTEIDSELQDPTAEEVVQCELVLDHGSPEQVVPPEHDYAPPAEPEYFCGVCGKSFSAERRVRQHMSSVHLEKKPVVPGKKKASPPKKIVCEWCGKKYASNAHLRYHQRTHTGEKPYQCPMCPKAFTMPFFLQIHVRTHTGERPYPCTSCDKAFNNPAALWRHNRVHTGEKPYTCETCGKSFTQSNSLKLHIRTVHLKQPAPYVSKERRLKQLLKKQMETHEDNSAQLQAKPKQNAKPRRTREVSYVIEGESLDENFVLTY